MKVTSSTAIARTPIGLRIAILGVAFNGLLLVTGTLLDSLVTHPHLRHHLHISGVLFSVPIIAGLTLLYLSSLLARRKRTAWAVTLPIYTFILGLNGMELLLLSSSHYLTWLRLLRNIVLPLIIMAALIYYRTQFRVKSDLSGFRQSLLFIVIMLTVAFAYGVAGFMLMDEHDFHHEISFGEAVHRTIDQFGLTTTSTLVPYTRRARLFTDSLSVVSIGAVAYGVISLFQPLRARFSDQTDNRELMRELLERYPASSEDFFKLWPKDKHYFFTFDRSAGLALTVHRGIALVVGDPAGDSNQFPALLDQFQRLCYANDWRPAYIHTEPKYTELYEAHRLVLQKIGEEAVVNIEHFQKQVATTKDFRHISSKFEKLGFYPEMLKPPHSPALLDRLKEISDEWLSQPGREERGFMMGYFATTYLDQCEVMVARDKAGTIQGFINRIPSFDGAEANFDLLRHSAKAPGNINDFLLINFIDYIGNQGCERLNLGLSPLAGFDKKEGDNNMIDSTLRFAYANGDRLYSFSGLHRFKAKYEPDWQPRYIAYRGRPRTFTRVLSALNTAMKVRRP
jgi:phosphatidylglycerol lysyltransferase